MRCSAGKNMQVTARYDTVKSERVLIFGGKLDLGQAPLSYLLVLSLIKLRLLFGLRVFGIYPLLIILSYISIEFSNVHWGVSFLTTKGRLVQC